MENTETDGTQKIQNAEKIPGHRDRPRMRLVFAEPPRDPWRQQANEDVAKSRR
jgi:hypothetical protein